MTTIVKTAIGYPDDDRSNDGADLRALPRTSLTPRQVADHVRVLLGDAVNDFGGSWDFSDIDDVNALTPDTPTLTGVEFDAMFYSYRDRHPGRYSGFLDRDPKFAAGFKVTITPLTGPVDDD